MSDEDGGDAKVTQQVTQLHAHRLAELPVHCIQVSVDGATAGTYERVRPGGDFAAAIGAIRHLVARSRAPQLVFVPTRLNIHELIAAYDLAGQLGCEAFVTGPLMRLATSADGSLALNLSFCASGMTNSLTSGLPRYAAG